MAQRSRSSTPRKARPDPRAGLAQLMRATLADEAAHHNWTYHAVRPCPMPQRPFAPGTRLFGDCSKGVQFLSWWNNDPDPMHNSYGPWGNSYTLWLCGQRVDSARELDVGDIITFGSDGDEHATRVLEAASAANNWDPLLWSWGHQGAPNTYRLSWDRRPAQFIRVALPEYVPTPAARLRAMTGWFAWVAWRLGEGDWHSYRAADASVRPNVPSRIPLAWWRRYAKFLLRRKKGNKPTTG